MLLRVKPRKKNIKSSSKERQLVFIERYHKQLIITDFKRQGSTPRLSSLVILSRVRLFGVILIRRYVLLLLVLCSHCRFSLVHIYTHQSSGQTLVTEAACLLTCNKQTSSTVMKTRQWGFLFCLEHSFIRGSRTVRHPLPNMRIHMIGSYAKGTGFRLSP